MPKIKKREKNLLLILVLVVAIGAVVIWWSLQPPREIKVEKPKTSAQKKEEKLIRKLPDKLDFSVFKHPWFDKARIHGDLPVEAGVTGRENPFEPY